jgi:amino acid transporter
LPFSVANLLLGRRLANREHRERKIGAFEGVPAMGLDGLGSSAYGPEAALTVLIPLGAASVSYVGWVMAPIVALLAILFASYWQTIREYPNNGGAYIVARENLGTNASLLAAAALMIDYVLNVAVGISAGVAALVSALPSLHSHTLSLCLAILALITLINLRGTRETGRLLAIPTYVFVGSFFTILMIGAIRTITTSGHPVAAIPPPPLSRTIEAATVWLLLRAFASGCTAMTGVEAVSNAMTAFREPRTRHGHATLAAIVMILGTLLVGTAYLTRSFRIGAMDQTQEGYQSVLSQLAHAVVGDSAFYYLAIGSLLSVLALSANTSFVGFPRLCRAVAADGFLPKSFAIAGHRLVFSAGIVYLALCAGLLLFVFGGITDRLIPLFAVGAFLTFTISQTGMVFHWRRVLRSAHTGGRRANLLHLCVNSVGAVTTAGALLVIVATKFRHGAWITVIAIPAVIALLKAIREYYVRLERNVRDPAPLELADTRPPIVIVATERWNKLTDKSLRLALSLSPDVVAVHLNQLAGPDATEEEDELREQWHQDVELPALNAGLHPPRLIILQAQYRAMHEPVLELARELEAADPGRRVAILVPEVVRQRWYQYLLHTFRPSRLRFQLLKFGGPSLIVVQVPWYLEAVDEAAGSRSETENLSEQHRVGAATLVSTANPIVKTGTT